MRDETPAKSEHTGRATDQMLIDWLRSLAAKGGKGTASNIDARPLGRIADRFETYRRLDSEAATHVETVICMRTAFTGDPPYVGWKGLGLALVEALDERDRLRAAVARFTAERASDGVAPSREEMSMDR